MVMTESGNNFLLSCSDLKNINLMSKSFPKYTGKVRSGHAMATSDIEKIINESYGDNAIFEVGDCIAPNINEIDEQDPDTEVKVKPDEKSIKLEYEGDMREDQILAAITHFCSALVGIRTVTWWSRVSWKLSVQLRKVRRRPMMMISVEMTMLTIHKGTQISF